VTLPNVDTLAGSLGGALNDYDIPVLDPTTDRPASALNKAYANLAMGTHTAIRAWVNIGFIASVWTIVAHGQDSVWGSALGTAPSISVAGTGQAFLTWPTSINDEIPVGSPGYSSPHSMSAFPRAVWGRMSAGTSLLRIEVIPIGAMFVVVGVFDITGTLVNPPTASRFSIFFL
jgi:hypothetical protein